ncbi:PREDICTED: complement component C7-like isoform X1 [Cyprinodon variegatus]|uniref:Complement component C7 n=1 Tax=Cyprinodon variegatus TaxID=28743 RepID=A0A3Q2CW67_CYPVA|nr:PREDICTED: complement component C7-like isoform X1 [Cyprinodon variegatus]
MKNIMQLCATVLLLFFSLFLARVFCVQRVHCEWGPYGSWSVCDPCTKLQTRSRAMSVYAQYNGNPCDGGRSESRSCETAQACPLDDGCGDRFRCRSGKCVSKSLLCNGDQDCEGDGLDEHDCAPTKYITCVHTVPPPQVELLGIGFDVVSGKSRGSVINTKSFGGQCRSIFSGVHNTHYRLPLSTIQYNFLVKVQKDFSDEMFASQWHYAKDVVNRQTVSGTTTGYRNYDFHETLDMSETKRLVVLRNEIEVVQFQSNSPRYLPISEEFWMALAKLPPVYDYTAYRKILERFGTHYISEGSMGGSLTSIFSIDEETEKHITSMSFQNRECEKKKRWILFFPITRVDCSSSDGSKTTRNENRTPNNDVKVKVMGGGPAHIAALENMQLGDLDRNWEMYSNWADSIRSFPVIIKQKLQPISELVKEVQCSGVKRLYLRKAIEQYQHESHPCHCQPCRNNGLAVLDGDKCKCICKAGTSGLACEVGVEADNQQGVIHGSWSCWSAWSLCSGGRISRRRTCTNPYPQNGGHHCIGESMETSRCEDQEELQYLRTMEPQCFDRTLPALQKCATPPSLRNGYILDPKDDYYVGNTVEYTCTAGFFLLGNNILHCTADQTWSANPGLCTALICKLPSLPDVIASPLQEAYNIGESVTLSCPEGSALEGEAMATCDSSLHFSPDPAQTRCIQAEKKHPPTVPTTQCKEWERTIRGKCVCKMPYECSSSLELCAISPSNGQFASLTVCKMQALRCMGKNIQIVEDSNCKWPQHNRTSCTECHMWENCDDQSNQCRCKDSADCSTPGLNVCVRVGEDLNVAPQTMSECDAGIRRCKGEKVMVVSILPCAS